MLLFICKTRNKNCTWQLGYFTDVEIVSMYNHVRINDLPFSLYYLYNNVVLPG
jgi:hypothetical protein